MIDQISKISISSIIWRTTAFVVIFLALLVLSSLGENKGELRTKYASFFQASAQKIYGGKKSGKEFQFLPYHKDGSQFDTVIRLIDHKEIAKLKKEIAQTGKKLNYRGQALPVDSFVMSLLHILAFVSLIAVSPVAWWTKLISLLAGSLLLHIYHLFAIRFYLGHLVNESEGVLHGTSQFLFDMIKHPGLSLMFAIFVWFFALFLTLSLTRDQKRKSGTNEDF